MSSAASQKWSTAASSMTMVPPGSETGVYFIALGNLPFQTNWQHLKDFIRQVCEVDHVEVFPKSTTGWVKVTGHDNFVKAFELLNGAWFQNRALQADGRNEYESIPIRDLHLARNNMNDSAGHTASKMTSCYEPQTEMYSTTTYSNHTSGGVMLPINSCETGYASTGYVTTSPTSYYGPGTTSTYDVPIRSAGSRGSCTFPTSYNGATSVTLPYYDSNLKSPTADSYCSSQAYTVSYASYDYSPQDSYQTTTTEPCVDSYVNTEKRKLVIRNIPYTVNEEQISNLVHETAGSDADKIQDINQPRDKKGIKYAIVLVSTTEAAKKLERKLNHKNFKGRQLAVKFASEGATAAETTARPASQQSGKRKDRNKDKDKEREKERDRDKRSNGSKSASSALSDRKDRERDKESRHVVIADGSSKRKST